MRFSSFIDKKTKQAKNELGIIRDVLKQADFDLEEFLDHESPYIFLKNPEGGLDFDGVRIYKVGSTLAYRVQKESKTEPYGRAYALDVEDAFADLITDLSEENAIKQVKKAIVEEFKNFFQKSIDAQEKINSDGAGSENKLIISGGAGDLSNSM